jgi:hypothetical protein
MWQALNRHSSSADIRQRWDAAFKAYEVQLAQVLPRLNEGARRFFKEVSLHDAATTKVEFGDRIDSSPTRMGHEEFNAREAKVRLHATSDQGDTVYVMEYTNVTRFEVKSPGVTILFPVSQDATLGDWGYDELTEAEDRKLRHEILFASGATILIEFSDINVNELVAK